MKPKAWLENPLELQTSQFRHKSWPSKRFIPGLSFSSNLCVIFQTAPMAVLLSFVLTH